MNKLDVGNIVYINADKDTERRLSIEQQLTKYQVNAKRFAAITDDFDKYSSDWRLLYEENFVNSSINKRLSRAEIGCLLSHLEVIRSTEDAGLLVLEDDIDLSPIELWKFSLSELLSRLPKTAQILQLTKYFCNNTIYLQKLQIGALHGGMWGTAAYWITNDLARTIVANHFVQGKWEISQLPSNWQRPSADSILYSFGGAFTMTLLTLKDFETTIGGGFIQHANKVARAIHMRLFQNASFSIDSVVPEKV